MYESLADLPRSPSSNLYARSLYFSLITALIRRRCKGRATLTLTLCFDFSSFQIGSYFLVVTSYCQFSFLSCRLRNLFITNYDCMRMQATVDTDFCSPEKKMSSFTSCSGGSLLISLCVCLLRTREDKSPQSLTDSQAIALHPSTAMHLLY